jgi:hypothetical protein
MTTLVSQSIAAANTFTPAKQVQGHISISISGTFVATVTVQRSKDNVTWHDVDSWNAPTQSVGFDPELMYYRIGIKTEQYTSGTAVVRFGKIARNPSPVP